MKGIRTADSSLEQAEIAYYLQVMHLSIVNLTKPEQQRFVLPGKMKNATDAVGITRERVAKYSPLKDFLFNALCELWKMQQLPQIVTAGLVSVLKCQNQNSCQRQW